ncbi:MAG TPA: hypothetical protein EYH58_03770 [Aquifex aeolicus]|nr:hypothetical protein [Aquifex aeolicus]
MILSKKVIYTLVLLLFTFYLYTFLVDFIDFRNFLNTQYVKFKDFVFLLENTEYKETRPLNEKLIRNLAQKYSINLKEISYREGRYVISLREVDGRALVLFIRDLEQNGVLESLEAVDNTGKGKFDIKIILRPF